MKIIIIGFMGSGKSTVSALLAKRLKMPLIEIDQEIINHAGGLTIPQIFDRRGEAGFRELESEIVQRYSSSADAVISAGGGTPERDRNMVVLKSGESRTIYLEVTLDTVLHRLGDQSDRPLLRNPEGARALHQRRQAVYRRYADLIVSGENSPENICAEIEQFLKGNAP